MNTTKIWASAIALSAFVTPAMAFHSTITDTNAGMATNVVETQDVIHVYTYTGASSEDDSSTFDAGETWFNVSTEPKTTSRYMPSYTSTSLVQTSAYIDMVDGCTGAGNTWDFKTESCQE